MCLVNAVETVTLTTRASRKLGYEIKQQVVTSLLVEILKIEVEVGHDGCPSFAYGNYVLNNGGTCEE